MEHQTATLIRSVCLFLAFGRVLLLVRLEVVGALDFGMDGWMHVTRATGQTHLYYIRALHRPSIRCKEGPYFIPYARVLARTIHNIYIYMYAFTVGNPSTLPRVNIIDAVDVCVLYLPCTCNRLQWFEQSARLANIV